MKIPFSHPWITNEDVLAVKKSLRNQWLSNGPNLHEFENNFRKTLQVKHALGVSSATAGLHLALRALNIQPGDEVIVPTMTFAATANAAIYCGAIPILVDVEYDTLNISVQEINRKITKRTKAIIAVHYGGQSCDMSEIMKICKKKGIKLVEDCAHALGTTYQNKHCGTIGDVGVFSFYPTKIITSGEGGMVVTNDNSVAEKIIKLRSHGINISADKREKYGQWYYEIDDLGYNYRLDEMSAALGNSQLKRYKIGIQKRREIAHTYDEYLQNIDGIIIPKRFSKSNHVFHLYAIKIEDHYPLSRDQLFTHLAKNGIGCSVQYTPIHRFSYTKKYTKFNDMDFPTANNLYKKILCLPIFPGMTKSQVKKVVNILLNPI